MGPARERGAAADRKILLMTWRYGASDSTKARDLFMNRSTAEEEDGRFDMLQPSIERRYHRRYPSGLPADIDVDGAVRAVTIHDLSLGGVGLTPAFPALVGDVVGIEIGGLLPKRTIRARVLSVSRHRTHLLFNCTEEEQTALIYFLLTTGEQA